MSDFQRKARINQKQTTQQRMLGPEPFYEVTLDFPLSERQRLALYLVRHLGGLNVALKKMKFTKFFFCLTRFLFSPKNGADPTLFLDTRGILPEKRKPKGLADSKRLGIDPSDSLALKYRSSTANYSDKSHFSLFNFFNFWIRP